MLYFYTTINDSYFLFSIFQVSFILCIMYGNLHKKGLLVSVAPQRNFKGLVENSAINYSPLCFSNPQDLGSSLEHKLLFF